MISKDDAATMVRVATECAVSVLPKCACMADAKEGLDALQTGGDAVMRTNAHDRIVTHHADQISADVRLMLASRTGFDAMRTSSDRTASYADHAVAYAVMAARALCRGDVTGAILYADWALSSAKGAAATDITLPDMSTADAITMANRDVVAFHWGG